MINRKSVEEVAQVSQHTLSHDYNTPHEWEQRTLAGKNVIVFFLQKV